MKTTKIHVIQHVIKANRKHGKTDPCLTVKDHQQNRYGHIAIIKDKDGNEVARVVYSPDKPLSCGAHCWIETKNTVEVIDHNKTAEPISIPYGEYENCGVCKAELPKGQEDPEFLIYHGYCSSGCASVSNYSNYQI